MTILEQSLITNSGIYKITNLITGDFYIGSSISLKQRKGAHFTALKHNKHYNDYLQNTVNKYGLENFRFEVIDYFKFPINYDKKLQSEHLVSRELFYIHTLNPIYNLATSDDQFSFKLPCSDQIKRIRSINYYKNTNLLNSSRNCEKVLTGKKRTLEERIHISKGKRKSNKGLYIGMYDIKDNLIQRFLMASQASEITGIGRSAIANQLSNRHKGYSYLPSGEKVKFKKINTNGEFSTI